MWQLCWGLDHTMAIPGKHHVVKYMQQTCNAIDWIARNDLLTEAWHNIAWKDLFGWRPPEDINMSSKQLLVFPRLAIYMESCHKLLSITCQSNQHKSALVKCSGLFAFKQLSLHVISKSIALLLGFLWSLLVTWRFLHGLNFLHGFLGALLWLDTIATLIRFFWLWPCLMHHVALPEYWKASITIMQYHEHNLFVRQGTHQWWYQAKPSLHTHDMSKLDCTCMHDSKQFNCKSIAGLGPHSSSSSWIHWTELPWWLSNEMQNELVLQLFEQSEL